MPENDLEKALAQVDESRRTLLRKLFIGTAIAAAVPMIASQAMAQKAGEDPGPGGKCDDGLVVSKKTGKCAAPKKKKSD